LRLASVTSSRIVLTRKEKLDRGEAGTGRGLESLWEGTSANIMLRLAAKRGMGA
jgi:hypothetical protein